MNVFEGLPLRRSPLALSALVVAAVTATGAGAASIHRFAVASGTGSEGAASYNNTSFTGSALQGTVSTSPDTSVTLPFGVLGEYLASTKQFGIGVAGVSTTGYGVGAEALGANAAVYALSKGTTGSLQDQAVDAISMGTGDAIDGYNLGTGSSAISAFNQSKTSGTVFQTAMYAENDVDFDSALFVVDEGTQTQNFGVYTQSAKGFPFVSMTFGSGSQYAGILSSQASGGGEADLGLDTGEGAILSGGSGTAKDPALAVVSLKSSTDLIDAQVPNPQATTAGGVISSFIVQGKTQNRSTTVAASTGSDVQVQGDVYLTGKVYTGCAAFPAVAMTTCSGSSAGASVRSRSGQMVDAFASRNANPTVEDEGEAQLVNGAAHVALDATFASTMSTNSRYLVFTTPNGDSRGVYVTNKTPNGFDVHENAGGRSTLSFDYRIVAKAADATTSRMAIHTGREPIVHETASHTRLDLRTFGALRKAHLAHRGSPKVVNLVSNSRANSR